MNPGGMVHEQDCRWLHGAWAGSLSQSSYKLMPANQAPAGKKHCSRC
jgi:hypothetical protein